MLDEYEKQQWERIKNHRFMIVDALARADDGLDEDAWDRDQWGYAYIQLSRAATELHALIQTVLRCRSRRMTLEGEMRIEPRESD